MKVFNTTALGSLALAIALFSTSAAAELIDSRHWVVKPGDSVYKIARALFPGDNQQQSRLRQELIKQNPAIFKDGKRGLSVGDRLTLPDFAVKKPAAPARTVVPTTVVQKAPEPRPQQAAAATPDPEDVVGQVVINIGNLKAENRGTQRTLTRQSNIYQGDTISTGSGTHTQVRMKDGALLSLRPNTDLKITDYRYNGSEDGSERSLIELIKGGFRTITGAIGHRNKQNYRVRTSIATIGIRGTHYSLMLCQQQNCTSEDGSVDDGLYGGISDGSIVVENESGIHQFNNDQFFQLTSSTAAPVEFLLPPSILRNGDEDKGGSRREEETRRPQQHAIPRKLALLLDRNDMPDLKNRLLLLRDSNTDSTTLASLLQPGKAPAGASMLAAFSTNGTQGWSDVYTAGTDPTSGDVTAIHINSLTKPDGTTYDFPLAGLQYFFDAGTNSYSLLRALKVESIDGSLTATLVPSSVGANSQLGVNWGRWNGEFSFITDATQFNTDQNWHFIYSDNVTSPTQLANLGGLLTQIYQFDSIKGIGGGTLPTDVKGNLANSVVITMGVDFGQQVLNNYSVTANFNAGTYLASGGNGLALDQLSNGFSLSGSCPVSTSCFGQAHVVFVGDQAQGAMTSYTIQDATDNITGTALLVR